MKKILLLMPVILIFLFSSCARTDGDNDGPELILRYADNQPEYYPTTKAARYFASLVEERTNGRISIEVYGDGQLGGEVSVLEQLLIGGVDFSRFSLGTLSETMPEMALLEMPYLYRDSEHMWKVLDGKIGKDFLAAAKKYGAEGMCWFDAGARSFYTRNPIRSPKDLEGKTIRVQEAELMGTMIELLGAKSIQIPYSDVYSALQLYKIDGAENNMPSYYYTGHYLVAPYFYMDEHFRLPEIMLMSSAASRKIESIDPGFLIIIKECAAEASLYERKIWKETEEEAAKALSQTNVVVTKPSEEDIEAIRSMMAPIYSSLSEEEALIVEEIRST